MVLVVQETQPTIGSLLHVSNSPIATGSRTEEYPATSLFRPLVADTTIEILRYLPVDTMLRLRLTSHLADQYVSVTLTRRLRTVLGGKDMKDYGALLREMERINALVTGIAALHILYPFAAPPSAVDVYIPRGLLTRFHKHLIEQQGGSDSAPPPPDVHPTFPNDPPPNGGPDALRPRDILVDDVRYVQIGSTTLRLSQCPGESVLPVILKQWLSALHNYVSPRSFCVAYPRLTRARQALLSPIRLPPWEVKTEPWIDHEKAKWVAEGWQVADCPGALGSQGRCPGDQSSGCAATARFWGDALCTRGSLGSLGSAPIEPGILGQVARSETFVWWRGGRRCGGDCPDVGARDGQMGPPRIRATAWSLLQRT